MSVSNEDREAAWKIIADVRDASPRDPQDVDSWEIVDSLVSHGWGPRPTVSAAKLEEVTDRYAHKCPHCPKDLEEWVVHLDDVAKLLRECGIEVTE